MKNSMLLIATVLFSGVLFAQPIITQHPSGETVCSGDCANLSVAAVGGGLQYQWLEITGMDTTDIAGENDTSLEYCPDSGMASVVIVCEVMDSNGLSVLSNAANILTDSCLAPIADFTWTWDQQEMCFTNTSIHAHTVFWFFGDGTTNDDNLDLLCHTYGTKEIYYVKLHAYNDHGVDIVEKVLDLLGSEEVSESELSMFPNPASSYVNVHSNAQIEHLQLYDVQGRTVLERSPMSATARLDLVGMPAGVYFLTISSRDAKTQLRLIVQ